MQMYRVKTARNIAATGTVELQDVVVCASSHENAIMMTAEILGLPISGTEFETSRVKPSLFQLSRRVEDRSLATYSADTVPDKVACRATFPGVTENMPDKTWHAVSVAVEVLAKDDEGALRQVAEAVRQRAHGREPSPTLVRDLDVACNKITATPNVADIDANALFTFRQIFSGGDARPG